MSIAINKVFPKNIAIAENKTPIKGKSTILDKSSPKKEEKKEDIKEEMPKEEAMNVDKNEIKDDEKNNDSQSVKYVVGKVEVYSDLTSGKPDLTSYVDTASKIQLRDNQYITITNVEMSK